MGHACRAVVAEHALTMADARVALEFAAALAECAEEAEFAARVEILAGLTGADGVIVVGTRDWMGEVVVELGDPTVYRNVLLDAVGRDWRDHPLMGPDLTVADRRARRLSDFVAPRDWRRRGLFNDFYRPLGMTNEASVQLAWGPAGASCCVALHRSGPDFGPRELALLDLLAPHLRATRARLTHPRPRLRTTDEPHPATLARRLPLTPREAEVLAHLAAGDTNEAIAAELTISRHTVIRHLEHIYAKLGVHTRTAAASEALRVLYEER